MAVQILKRRLWPGVGLLLACLALFGLGRLVAHEAPALGLAPARAAELPQAELRLLGSTRARGLLPISNPTSLSIVNGVGISANIKFPL